jgi:glucose/arabinose dehydrogenase
MQKRIAAATLIVFLMLVSLGLGAATASPTIDLEKVGDGFSIPVYLTHPGDGSGRLFVVEKAGTIRELKAGKPVDPAFLDITPLVRSQENERGLLGLAFHPDYKTNGLFYVYYTDQTGQLTIARYQVSASNPDQADPNSAKILLQVKHTLGNHNGGSLLFGPDGYLYFGMGDGGGAGDPFKNGQNTKVLLGKISRIDVNSGDPYGIPKDNPFADGKDGNRPEIWEYGLRNPWRFSFDRKTGDLYIADVGQDSYEEVDFVKAGSPGGLDFGWSIMEGLHCFKADSCDQTGLTLPILEYGHDKGCSIIGGYVYRGTKFPDLQGIYFHSDYCSSRIWGVQQTSDGKWASTELSSGRGLAVSSFGQGEDGELYMLDSNSGSIYHLIGKS